MGSVNNYSWLDQKLHLVALASQVMREITFDAEAAYASTHPCNENHVFVAGLARSGSTALMNAIYASDEFASLSYADMPFVLAPNLWSKLSGFNRKSKSIERAHGDGIIISTESPEAFEEVFWKTFSDLENKSQEYFLTYINCIIQRYRRNRYLSKNNQNIRRLGLISSLLPHSKILIPFRDPTQHSYSLLSQHNKFLVMGEEDKFITRYMKWIGHTEFGPNYQRLHLDRLEFQNEMDINHWLEQWYLTYKNCLDLCSKAQNIYLICYESLCDKKEIWINLLNLLEIRASYNYEFRESKKDITLNFDHSLLSRCYCLYKQLVSKSLNASFA